MRFLWVIKFAVVVTALMMQSCSASYHLKRAIAKDPTIRQDTIIKVDTTIVTNEVNVVDTLVVRDTIVREINREGVKIKIQRIHDTIRVDVVCPPDTIRITQDIPVETIVYKEAPRKRSVYDHIEMIVFMILLISLALMVRSFMK